MKITITIDSNPIGGTRTTVSIDDGSEPIVTTGSPLPIAVAADDLPSGTTVELKKPIKPDPPQPVAPAVRKPAPARPVARVEKTCANCGDTFVAEGKSIARAKFCENCKSSGKKPIERGSEPKTKPQPQFLPGYEKSPEEIEKLRTSFPLPGAIPTGSLRHTEKSSDDFADPWDCQKCRDHMHTCDFHAGMEADGKTPPKQGSRAPISNNQF